MQMKGSNPKATYHKQSRTSRICYELYSSQVTRDRQGPTQRPWPHNLYVSALCHNILEKARNARDSSVEQRPENGKKRNTDELRDCVADEAEGTEGEGCYAHYDDYAAHWLGVEEIADGRDA